jgi:hypothetical protein
VIRFLGNLLLMLWLAFLLAVAVQSHRPVSLAGVQGLEPSKGTPPDLLDRMEKSIWLRNSTLDISEADVNRYLAATVTGNQRGATSKFSGFDRVALSFRAAQPAQPARPAQKDKPAQPAQEGHPATCTVWFQWTSFHIPCTASVEFTLRREKTNFVVEPIRGAYGRLPVFRGALATVIPACRSLCGAFEDEIKTLFQMNQITILNNKVVLDPRFDIQR